LVVFVESSDDSDHFACWCNVKVRKVENAVD
jgi:hypothetical protein